MPDRDFRPMPEEGAYVPRNDYYERLIIGGDLVITDPPAIEAAVPSSMPANYTAADHPVGDYTSATLPPVNKI
jgi:hypothetical protein